MLIFNIDESNKFQFNMEVFGDNDTGASPIVEFKIRSDKASLSFPATLVENSVYEVNVPALGGMIKPGSYTTEIVVILGDRYFVPLTENIEVRTPVKAVVSNFRANNASAAPPRVNVEFVKPHVKVEEKIVMSPPRVEPIKEEPVKVAAPPKVEPLKVEPKTEETTPKTVVEEVKTEAKPKPEVKKDPLVDDFWSFGKKKKS